jgi:hypothetical protein
MALSKLQARDRQEWLSRLRARVQKEKAVTIKLRDNGASLAEVRAEMGKGIEIKVNEDGSLLIAVVQQEQPAESAA